MADVRLRTTVVIEYECAESVADVRCNDLTPYERAEWVAHYVEHRGSAVLVSAVTERATP